MWGMTPTNILENTYYHDGPTPGIRGKGATGLDVILDSPCVAVAMKSSTPRWGVVAEKHVPLQVDLSLTQLSTMKIQQDIQGNVKCNIEVEQIEIDTHEEYELARQM